MSIGEVVANTIIAVGGGKGKGGSIVIRVPGYRGPGSSMGGGHRLPSEASTAG